MDSTYTAPVCEHSATCGYNPNGCSWCGTDAVRVETADDAVLYTETVPAR